jgi:Tfp pilus assembly protein PilN
MRHLTRDEYDVMLARVEHERRRAALWMLTALCLMLVCGACAFVGIDATRTAAECLHQRTQDNILMREQSLSLQQYDRLLREQIDTSRVVIHHLEQCQARGSVFDARL